MTCQIAIDHLVILTADLEDAGAAFRDAGFLTTSLTHHSAAMGTANICVMFRNTYVELLGIVAETEASAGWRALLADGAGLRGVALRSDNIDETGLELDRRRIPREAARHFSRSTPEGELRFSVIRIRRDATPGLQCLYCQHHTRDLLWRQDLLRHPNGAGDPLAVALPAAHSLAAFSLIGEPRDATPVSSGTASLTLPLPRPLGFDKLDAIRRLAGLELIFR
jgi:Glyoxalase-like domain